MTYVKQDLQLFQQITVDGVTTEVEVDVFDFDQLDVDYIINDAQERLLNLIVRRQTLNIDKQEIINCIQIPIFKELNGRF